MIHQDITYANGEKAHQIELDNYFIDFSAGTKNTLFITFENALPPLVRPDGQRYPWSYKFLHDQGFPVLGIKTKKVDWYRKPDLHRYWRSAEFTSFLARFPRVILYGSSMGGYAALAFAETISNAEVIAHNPQSTLSDRLAPWDTRFPIALGEDWEGDFADAAIGAANAKKVFVSYDPFNIPDRRHINRLDPANLIHIKVPLVGHALPGWLLQMGVLKDIVLRVADETLTQSACNEMARKRKNIARYYLGMAARSKNIQVIRACLDKADTISPDDAETLKMRITVLKQHNRWDELVFYLEGRLAAAPDDAMLNHHLSEALLHTGKTDRALGYAAAAAGLSPANAQILVHLSEVLTRLGEWDKAEGTARHAITADPKLPAAHRILSRVLWARGDHGMALLTAHEAVQLDPRNTLGLFHYAKYLHALSSTRAAIQVLERTRLISPDHLSTHLLLANCLCALEDWDGAEKILIEALRINPASMEAKAMSDRLLAAKMAA